VHGLTPVQAGAVLSAYGLGAIAGGPLGGTLSDRIGRRPTLVVSLIAGGVSMLVLGLVARTATITLAALATGLLYEMYRPVVAATVADVVLPDDRPRAYGLIYWAVNLGASVAPLLGGVIAARSYRALFAVDALDVVAGAHELLVLTIADFVLVDEVIGQPHSSIGRPRPDAPVHRPLERYIRSTSCSDGGI
jgi:MFS family permease